MTGATMSNNTRYHVMVTKGRLYLPVADGKRRYMEIGAGFLKQEFDSYEAAMYGALEYMSRLEGCEAEIVESTTTA